MIESAACRDSAAPEMAHVGIRLDDVTGGNRHPSDPNTARDWQRTHEELRRLARSRAGLDFEEGQWLLAAWRGGVHVRLGYGSFREYIERLFGYGSRLVQDKLRVAEALEGLPVLARALQDGQACWSVLRELTRVVLASMREALSKLRRDAGEPLDGPTSICTT